MTIKKKHHSKKKRFEDRKHLISITNMQCCLKTLKVSNGCKGVTQAHHLLKPWDGMRGMGMRSNDRNVIPLCMHHHGMLHTRFGSEKSFFEHFGLGENIGKVLAKNLWLDQHPDDDNNLPF